MRYSVYIFLLLFLLYGCSSSSVREQYGLKLKEFPIDCDSLIKSIEIDRLEMQSSHRKLHKWMKIY